MGRVRIIGGIHRSRVIQFKDLHGCIRPTPDRVRETLFNWLGQDLTSKICLDLFTGSGGLAFEAVSRNAQKVVCVEHDSNVVCDLRKNQQLLRAENLDIIHGSALNYLQQTPAKFDVIFLDPPYSSDLLMQSLHLITRYSVLANHGIIYVEYQKSPDLADYLVLKQGRAGAVNYALIIPKVKE